jgi:hypothetical protein
VLTALFLTHQFDQFMRSRSPQSQYLRVLPDEAVVGVVAYRFGQLKIDDLNPSNKTLGFCWRSLRGFRIDPKKSGFWSSLSLKIQTTHLISDLRCFANRIRWFYLTFRVPHIYVRKSAIELMNFYNFTLVGVQKYRLNGCWDRKIVLDSSKLIVGMINGHLKLKTNRNQHQS